MQKGASRVAAKVATALRAAALALLVGGAAAATAPTAAGAPRPDDAIALRSGPPIVGEIVTVGEDHFQVRTGERLAKIGFSKVQPASLYNLLKARTTLDDPDARLALSDRCARYGAFAGARAELRAARALAPSMRSEIGNRMSDLDDTEANWIYRAGMDHATAEPARWAEAVAAFAEVVKRFAGLPVADKAAAKLVFARSELAKQPKQPVRPEPGATKVHKKLEKWAKKIVAAAEARLIKAAAAQKVGRKWDAKAQGHKAIKAYREAADQAGEAHTWCAQVLRFEQQASAPVVKSAKAALTKAETQMVASFRALGSLYMIQKNWKLARAAVLHALELSPGNKLALQQKFKIESEMVRERPKDDGTKADKTVKRK